MILGSQLTLSINCGEAMLWPQVRVRAWGEYVTVTLQETLDILLALAAHIWEQVPQSVAPQYPCCHLEMFGFLPLTFFNSLSWWEPRSLTGYDT